MRKLIIEVPVECQNGHKAIWHIHIQGIEVIHLGVLEDKCDCPKSAMGEGYTASGGDPSVYYEEKFV